MYFSPTFFGGGVYVVAQCLNLKPISISISRRSTPILSISAAQKIAKNQRFLFYSYFKIGLGV
jgi:hypothetical protein